MAEVIVDNNLILRLSGEEVGIFIELISEVKSAYQPEKVVGFQIQPKFEVPEHIGEFSLDMYEKLFGTEDELEEE
jgi:hypothetical protein